MYTFRQSIGIVVVLSATGALAQSQSSPPSSRRSAQETESSAAVAQPLEAKSLAGLYSGTWVTTNRKLDGTMKCELKEHGKDRWQGRFWGVWQGAAFDYTVQFETEKANRSEKDEPAQKSEKRPDDAGDRRDQIQVSGKAMIDGAHYDWKGTLSPDAFDIQFTGSRYNGYSELARVKAKQPQPRKLAEIPINRN